MRNFDEHSTDQEIEQAANALTANGMKASVVDTGNMAKEKVLAMIPKGAEVFTLTSVTLDTLDIAAAINESDDYESVRNKLNILKDDREKARLAAAPEWAVGSVQAVTCEGNLYVVSNTGSQIPAYAYGAAHVIFVIGCQKIVMGDGEALRRIYEYVLPLEDKRARQVYGVPSNVSKLLQIHKEIVPDRINVIIVKQKVGF